MAMMDELVQAVARAASLTPAQSTAAVSGALRFLAARLPSPLFGELQVRLGLPAAGPPADADAAPGSPP